MKKFDIYTVSIVFVIVVVLGFLNGDVLLHIDKSQVLEILKFLLKVILSTLLSTLLGRFLAIFSNKKNGDVSRPS